MAFIGAVFLVVGFVVLIKILDIAKKSANVFLVAKLALADFRNPALNDSAKEVALQGHAKRLLRLFFLITFGGAAAVLAPTGLLWLLGQMDVLSFEAVMKMVLSWEFLVPSSALTVAVFWFTRKH
jgi:hypothetical protein